jgi:DNA-binding transcriptional LysR family regulator
MIGALDPELLRSFVAIAETGSFTAAGERVHRTQSAVSMQMKRLEELLGRQLFAKNGRGVALSPDGELFLGHARRVLHAHREAITAFDQAALDGRVIIGSPDDYASTFLPPVLARFAETHPRVEVEVVVDMSRNLIARIDEEEGPDMALVSQGSGESGGTIVHREPLVWAASAHHDCWRRDPLPLALFHQGCCFRKAALEALALQGRASRIAYTSVSIAGIYAALGSGLAVGPLLRSTVREGFRILGEAEGLPPLPQFGIVMLRTHARQSPILDALEQHILDSFARQPALVAA